MASSTPNETFFRNIVNHSADSIVVVDESGYIRYINPATERLFGRGETEMLGEMFGCPLVGGESAELDILLHDGSLATAEMRVSETDWDGERAYLAMLRDITDRKRMERMLRETGDTLDALYRCAPLAIVALQPDWRVSMWNPAAERMFGWTRGEVEGLPCPTLPKGTEVECAELKQVVQRGEAVVGRRTRRRRKDGGQIDVNVSLAPIRGEARLEGVMCIVEDISLRLQTEEKLHLANRIFENTQEGIIVTDAAGAIMTVNRAFTAVTGYAEAEVVGRKPSLLRSGRHDQEFYRRMWQSLAEEGQWRGEIWNRRKNGELYPEWTNISAIRNEQGEVTHYVAIFSDITLVKKNEERLFQLAHYDALTGLPNRFLFQDHLQLGLAQAARTHHGVGVLFLDLDRFKAVNDSLGHQAGDALLVEVARRLGACLREGDTLSRFGGDEFTAVLTRVDDEDGAAAVARKMIQALSVPVKLEGHDIFVTTSIGISLYPRDGNRADQLARAADMAMYKAKELGRNCYQFYRADALSDALSHQFVLENQLRRSLEREELRVYYQPAVDIETSRVTAIEALVRWVHPERGLVYPTEFIHLAEDIGLIGHIGEWVLREACRQNKAWQDAGETPMRVSVNISPLQLRDAGFVRTVAGILAETGLDGRWLELELTEGMVMQNVEESIRVLEALKNLGLWLSIDDFGTGYSSLGYLRRLPVDTLKIDRSFISDVTTNDDDATISRTIIALAQSLNLRVVAEGVESSGQLAFLRDNQCCDAQGFFFSEALPADELSRYLDSCRAAR